MVGSKLSEFSRRANPSTERCEVKYEYGLSWFKQALDCGQSLDSFVSRSGKSINVNQNIARQTSTAQEQGNVRKHWS